MSYHNIDFKDQRLLTLLFDMLRLLDLSNTASNSSLKSTSARAAITNSTLLLECISNSCLLSLSLPTKLLNEIDKLPPLAKLDYYLFHTNRQHIDRGCRESELAAEILKMRNHIVHPKPVSGSVDEETNPSYIDYGVTKTLRIPLDTRDWSVQTALLVSKAVIAFAKKFFTEWCELSKGRVTTILVVREKALIQRPIDSWLPSL